jgi:hypothetical protein
VTPTVPEQSRAALDSERGSDGTDESATVSAFDSLRQSEVSSARWTAASAAFRGYVESAMGSKRQVGRYAIDVPSTLRSVDSVGVGRLVAQRLPERSVVA